MTHKNRSTSNQSLSDFLITDRMEDVSEDIAIKHFLKTLEEIFHMAAVSILFGRGKDIRYVHGNLTNSDERDYAVKRLKVRDVSTGQVEDDVLSGKAFYMKCDMPGYKVSYIQPIYYLDKNLGFLELDFRKEVSRLDAKKVVESAAFLRMARLIAIRCSMYTTVDNAIAATDNDRVALIKDIHSLRLSTVQVSLILVHVRGIASYNSEYGFAKGSELIESARKILSDKKHSRLYKIGATKYALLIGMSEENALVEAMFLIDAICKLSNDIHGSAIVSRILKCSDNAEEFVFRLETKLKEIEDDNVKCFDNSVLSGNADIGHSEDVETRVDETNDKSDCVVDDDCNISLFYDEQDNVEEVINEEEISEIETIDVDEYIPVERLCESESCYENVHALNVLEESVMQKTDTTDAVEMVEYDTLNVSGSVDGICSVSEDKNTEVVVGESILPSNGNETDIRENIDIDGKEDEQVKIIERMLSNSFFG